jgi:hypothetical protein
MKQILLVSILVLVCTAQQDDYINTVKYWSAVSRGALEGFTRAFYNTPGYQINELCLGKSAG